MKNKALWCSIVVAPCCLIAIYMLTVFSINKGNDTKLTVGNMSFDSKPSDEKPTYSIENHGIFMQNQTGGTNIVNQKRKVIRQAKIKKSIRDGNYVIRITLNQTPGIWDQGVPFQLQVKLSAPYKTMKIIQGFPSNQAEVKLTENKPAGEYSFSTKTAPDPDQQIIFEATSDQDMDVIQFGVAPSD